MKHNLTFLVLITFCVILMSSSAQQMPQAPAEKAARLIAVPRALADDYARAIQTEQAALDSATQTPQWKDYQTAQQQRLKQEAIMAGELGCKPSLARIPRDNENRIIVGKDGRIESFQCLEAQNGKP